MMRSATAAALLMATAAADPCECLNWKQVYETRRVACGEGQELMQEKMGYRMAYWAPQMFPKATELCQNYGAMDNNMCFNWEMPHQYGKDKADSQWCYVDSKCTKLNGGRKVPDSETIVEWVPKPLLALIGIQNGAKVYEFIMTNFHTPQPLKRDVSVKICGGSDRLSRNMDPDALMDMGKAGGMHVEYLTKMAYNVLRDPHDHHVAHPIWQDVRSHIGKGGDVEKLPKDVAAAIKANVPVIVDTDAYGHHDKSQRIIKGSKVYKMNAQCPHNSCKGVTKINYSNPKGHDIGEL